LEEEEEEEEEEVNVLEPEDVFLAPPLLPPRRPVSLRDWWWTTAPFPLTGDEEGQDSRFASSLLEEMATIDAFAKLVPALLSTVRSCASGSRPRSELEPT